MPAPINKVLIANRGAIAVRVIRTIKALGKTSIGIYAEDDLDSSHIDAADEAYSLGTGTVSETYLNQDKILQIAQSAGADAIHPGYGFLSENAGFERRCAELGIRFLGPTAEQIEVFGLKHSARELAIQNEVPLLPGSDLLSDLDAAKAKAADIGFPLMLKSTAGGGGIGMRLCETEAELEAAFQSVQQLASNNFGDAGVFLERYVRDARHVEVQVLGDGEGDVIAFGTRDCSVQRRQQKVIEECPAPGIPQELLSSLETAAAQLLSAVSYRSVGTVEFIYDESRQEAYFLEVNTRLQVEHGVTEKVYDVDLVACMIKLAEGTLAPLSELAATHQPNGHAVQARVYAEDPGLGFQPAPGLLTHVAFPEGTDNLRIDTWVSPGATVSPNYDPMIAKIIYHAETRDKACAGLREALLNTTLYGTATNLDYLAEYLADEGFLSVKLATSALSKFEPETSALRILWPGTFTTVQDFPGRVGYWDIGVPPSGPFDDLSFRMGNVLLGNDEGVAGLEMTIDGPKIEFSCSVSFVLAGADIKATLGDAPLHTWQVYHAQKGDVLDIGKITTGLRGYLLIKGGIQCPAYLDSRSTFTLGQFGGHGGRVLRIGDLLPVESSTSDDCTLPETASPFFEREAGYWHLHVIYGPHGAPDFFTDSDIDTFFTTDYEVHFNSSRTGVRLIGPKPEWARNDGGEAGLHPSNIHDNAYAVGTVDFTGDMPVILGPDGPSLGGFVCPATLIRADLWKLGQLKPGDKIRFVAVSYEEALARYEATTAKLASIKSLTQATWVEPEITAARDVTPVLRKETVADIDFVFRPGGDDYLLMEVGEQVLDIKLRFLIHAIYRQLTELNMPGVLELTPGIRSLQIHFVPEVCDRAALMDTLLKLAEQVEAGDGPVVPSRVVHLPLSWDDPACQEAIDKYTQSVRPGAPWCPSNLEFIRRINGLGTIEDVKSVVFDATYLVMGLGDVYLGAPVATPVDPAHRLVTTKYNPARTWTAENSVGIGGAYMCVYGMEGPGGYQFVGRTIQMWNRYRSSEVFSKPWLLRFFDQIRFYPVSHEDLMKLREDFVRGRFVPEIEETEFSLAKYEAFLAENESKISAFRSQREGAFAEEMAEWRRTGQLHFDDAEQTDATDGAAAEVPEGHFLVESHVSGNVWKFTAEPGDTLSDEETLLVLESMKMELEVKPTQKGKLVEFLVKPGQQVTPGQSLALFSEIDD